MTSDAPLLTIEDLVVDFETDDELVRAVDGVSLSVRPGEALGVVGESGSGKSVTSLAVMGLLASPPAKIRGGRIIFDGQDLLRLDPKQRRTLSGREIAMVYQDSMAALNPTMTVGRQIGQVLRQRKRLSRSAAAARTVELLELVGIADARERLSDYPHQFSGGQRQRLLIAMALSCEPKLLIADEPTTALDVTVQAQILELVMQLREQLGMAVIWVTHDLGIVANLVDHVSVMYAGRVVERAPVRELFAHPRHPYTLGLLRSQPHLDRDDERLVPIPGGLPDMSGSIPHCAFAPRCGSATERCRMERPALDGAGGRVFACFHPQEVPT